MRPGSVLIEVKSMGVNNTDINTRIGWYDQGEGEDDEEDKKGWNGKSSPFPLVQGTDAAGIIVQVGEGIEKYYIGKTVLIQSCTDNGWFGTDFDGGFQEKVVVPFSHCWTVNNTLTMEELGAIPCSYGTAESMLIRARITPGMQIMVPGASGGVAGAVIDLCARARNVNVVAIVGEGKKALLEEAYQGLPVTVREGRFGGEKWSKIVEEFKGCVDVVVDNVGGGGVMDILSCLKRGGSYVTSGAIAGAKVEIDMRTIYLNDLSILGSTKWADDCFPNLQRFINDSKIKPLITKVFKLQDIAEAQKAFLDKGAKVGKFVLTP
ncbi:hypothetical protein TL16_g09725 [Triparma laevis f. inornata]|uniref:Enoyl reductase (ER) domain-containing protein n=1 Tax=Triparma laevis f. inornata TaxID=1714386 RepID=A0A9W7ENL1_9STRA|nr:hypothetical protein TL16_g09725 [Triparma laevis f. inornata]